MHNLDIYFPIVILALILLAKMAFSDIKTRQVRHRDLLCLTFLLICLWLKSPNVSVLPYTLMILGVGFLLHILRVLGAGDTKLLCVISLGVSPQYLSLLLYGTVFVGGAFAVAYWLYGYTTDIQKIRARGVPYAVPIAMIGGPLILLTYIS